MALALLSACTAEGGARSSAAPFIDEADVRHVQVQQVLVGDRPLAEGVIRAELMLLEVARRVLGLPGATPAARRAARQQVLRRLRGPKGSPTVG